MKVLIEPFTAELTGVPTRVLGCVAIDDVELLIVPTEKGRRLLVRRRYQQVVQAIDDAVILPAWLGLQRVRQGSE